MSDNDASEPKRYAVGAVAFKTYRDQLRELVPDLDDAGVTFTAAALAQVELLAVLLGQVFARPMSLDPRVIKQFS